MRIHLYIGLQIMFSCFAQDYHLVGGTSKLLEDFHREYNKDPNARCTAWEPATFSSAPDATKHRTAEFASQMKAPGWLLKIIGVHTSSSYVILLCMRTFSSLESVVAHISIAALYLAESLHADLCIFRGDIALAPLGTAQNLSCLRGAFAFFSTHAIEH